MANIDNLQPFTKENAKYYGSKGGKKSAEVRAERKSLKEQLQLLMNMPVMKEHRIEALRNAGFDDEEINNQLYLTYSLFEKALSGDIKAMTLVFKTLQSADGEKSNAFNDAINDIFSFWTVEEAWGKLEKFLNSRITLKKTILE